MQSHGDELHSFGAVIKAECNANNSDARFKDSQTVCLRDTMGGKYSQLHPRRWDGAPRTNISRALDVDSSYRNFL